MTRDTWHMTHSVGWTFSQNFSSLAVPVWDYQCFEYISTNHLLLTYWINDKAVCRTAPATPGLVNTIVLDHNTTVFAQNTTVFVQNTTVWAQNTTIWAQNTTVFAPSPYPQNVDLKTCFFNPSLRNNLKFLTIINIRSTIILWWSLFNYTQMKVTYLSRPPLNMNTIERSLR